MKTNRDMPGPVAEAMEERVRDVFGAVYSNISAGDLPPRPAPAANSRTGRAFWRLRAWAPVAAAAGVAAITVTAAIVVPGLTGRAPGGARARPAAGSLPGAPRFFAGVAMDMSKKNTPAVLKIYSSATGRPVAVVPAPSAALSIKSVARLGNDRTFVIAAIDENTCAARFLRLSVSAAGKPQSISTLSVPTIKGQVMQMAASADGKVLGFVFVPCGRGGSQQMVVIHLATGTISRWDDPGRIDSPSLNADGSVLGIMSSRTLTSSAVSVWMIRTDAPAGPLFDHARKAFRLPADASSMVLSPSGTQSYVAGVGSGSRPTFLKLYSTRSGTLIRRVLRLGPAGHGTAINGISLDAAGRHLLAYGFRDGSVVKAFDLRTGRSLSVTVQSLIDDGGQSTLAW